MIWIISFVLIVVVVVLVVVSAYFSYDRGYEEGCATITAMYHKDIAELEKELAELRNQNTGEAEKDFTDCAKCELLDYCWKDGEFVGLVEETERAE